MSIKGLYIHIPFSDHITGNVLSTSISQAYVQHIFQQIPHNRYESIYIGGGNLLSLDHKSLLFIFENLPDYFDLTVEINPHYLDKDKVNLLPLNTRVCLGVQKGKDLYYFEPAVKILRNHGINNISLEVPYGVENQSLTEYTSILKELIKLNPDHVSIHPETEDESFYEESVHLLTEHGYDHYEYVSFCVDHKKSAQTLVYNQYKDYHAVGLGSSYKVLNKRYTWSSNYETMDQIKVEEIDDLVFEYIMMHLHLKEGINMIEFKDKFGESTFNHWRLKLEHEDLLFEDESVRLKKLKYLDTILMHLINS